MRNDTRDPDRSPGSKTAREADSRGGYIEILIVEVNGASIDRPATETYVQAMRIWVSHLDQPSITYVGPRRVK